MDRQVPRLAYCSRRWGSLGRHIPEHKPTLEQVMATCLPCSAGSVFLGRYILGLLPFSGVLKWGLALYLWLAVLQLTTILLPLPHKCWGDICVLPGICLCSGPLGLGGFECEGCALLWALRPTPTSFAV